MMVVIVANEHVSIHGEKKKERNEGRNIFFYRLSVAIIKRKYGEFLSKKSS